MRTADPTTVSAADGTRSRPRARGTARRARRPPRMRETRLDGWPAHVTTSRSGVVPELDALHVGPQLKSIE